VFVTILALAHVVPDDDLPDTDLPVAVLGAAYVYPDVGAVGLAAVAPLVVDHHDKAFDNFDLNIDNCHGHSLLKKSS